MNNKGILWDMDGVLVDTGELHYQSWITTLSDFNIPFSRDFFRETFGMNNWSILNKLLGHTPDQALYQAISDQKEKQYRQCAHGHVKPLPGVLELLHLAKSKGLRQSISSSAPFT